MTNLSKLHKAKKAEGTFNGECIKQQKWLYIYMNVYMRVFHLTESRWPNEFDRNMTTTNLNNWIWLKLKPTNLLKLTNLNFRSGVLLILAGQLYGWNMLNCKKTSQKNARYFSQDYLVLPTKYFVLQRNLTTHYPVLINYSMSIANYDYPQTRSTTNKYWTTKVLYIMESLNTHFYLNLNTLSWSWTFNNS